VPSSRIYHVFWIFTFGNALITKGTSSIAVSVFVMLEFIIHVFTLVPKHDASTQVAIYQERISETEDCHGTTTFHDIR